MDKESQLLPENRTKLSEFHIKDQFDLINWETLRGNHQNDLIQEFNYLSIYLYKGLDYETYLELSKAIKLAVNVKKLNIYIEAIDLGSLSCIMKSISQLSIDLLYLRVNTSKYDADWIERMRLLGLLRKITQLEFQQSHSFQHISFFFCNLLNLKSLYLANDLTLKEEDLRYLFHAIQTLKNLRSLNIKSLILDSLNFQIKIKLFEQFISEMNHLEKLRIQLKLKNEQMIIDSEIFQNCWSNYNNLNFLSLTMSSSLINGFFFNLRNVSQLSQLILKIEDSITEQMSLIIGETISKQQYLTKLDIAFEEFNTNGNQYMKNLVKIFEHKEKLVYLNFSLSEGKYISDQEICLLFSSLSELKNLNALSIQLLEAKISFENIKLLSDILTSHRQLNKLRQVSVEIKSFNSIYLHLLKFKNNNLQFYTGDHYFLGFINKIENENKLKIYIKNYIKHYESQMLGLYHLLQDFPFEIKKLSLSFYPYQQSNLGLNNYKILGEGISNLKNLTNLSIYFKDSNKYELIEFGNSIQELSKLTKLKIKGDILFGIYQNLYKFPSLQYLKLINLCRNIQEFNLNSSLRTFHI